MPRNDIGKRPALLVRDIPSSVPLSTLASLLRPDQREKDYVVLAIRPRGVLQSYAVLLARQVEGTMERASAFVALHGGVLRHGVWGALRLATRGARVVVPRPRDLPRQTAAGPSVLVRPVASVATPLPQGSPASLPSRGSDQDRLPSPSATLLMPPPSKQRAPLQPVQLLANSPGVDQTLPLAFSLARARARGPRNVMASVAAPRESALQPLRTPALFAPAAPPSHRFTALSPAARPLNALSGPIAPPEASAAELVDPVPSRVEAATSLSGRSEHMPGSTPPLMGPPRTAPTVAPGPTLSAVMVRPMPYPVPRRGRPQGSGIARTGSGLVVSLQPPSAPFLTAKGFAGREARIRARSVDQRPATALHGQTRIPAVTSTEGLLQPSEHHAEESSLPLVLTREDGQERLASEVVSGECNHALGEQGGAVCAALSPGSPFLRRFMEPSGAATPDHRSTESAVSMARWDHATKERPMLGRLDLPQLGEPQQVLLAKVIGLAERLVRGTFPWYPPLAVGAVFDQEHLSTILRWRKKLGASAVSTTAVQAISDSYCRYYHLTRMHGSYFVSRLLASPGVPSDLVEVFGSVRIEYTMQRCFGPILRRIVTMMSFMPPRLARSDSVRTLQRLPASVWIALLAHAIWDECHLVISARRLEAIIREQGDMYNQSGQCIELWEAFLDRVTEPFDMTLVAAAGARPHGGLIPADARWFDCEKRVKREPRADDWPASRQGWLDLVMPEALAAATRPTQAALFRAGTLPMPGCVLRFRGIRQAGANPIERLQELMGDVIRGMSPRADASDFVHRLFQHVRPIRIRHRFGRTNTGLGPMEVEFQFASQSHATMALLTFHRWAQHFELTNPRLMALAGEEDEYGTLCALTCLVPVPVPDQLCQRLAALGAAHLQAVPEAVAVVSQSDGYCHVVLRYRDPLVAKRMLGERILVASSSAVAAEHTSTLVPYIPMDLPAYCVDCGGIGHDASSCPFRADVPAGTSTRTCAVCAAAHRVDPTLTRCITAPQGWSDQCVQIKAFQTNAMVMAVRLASGWEEHTLFAEAHAALLEQVCSL